MRDCGPRIRQLPFRHQDKPMWFFGHLGIQERQPFSGAGEVHLPMQNVERLHQIDCAVKFLGKPLPQSEDVVVTVRL